MSISDTVAALEQLSRLPTYGPGYLAGISDLELDREIETQHEAHEAAGLPMRFIGDVRAAAAAKLLALYDEADGRAMSRKVAAWYALMAAVRRLPTADRQGEEESCAATGDAISALADWMRATGMPRSA
jgi:hypothetical protein